MNNVANILKQLSFEENEDEEEENGSNGCHRNNSDSNHDDDFYVSEYDPQSTTDPIPSSQTTSIMIANAIAKPTNAQTAPSPTPNTHLVDGLQQFGSSKAAVAPKKITPIQTTR